MASVCAENAIYIFYVNELVIDAAHIPVRL